MEMRSNKSVSSSTVDLLLLFLQDATLLAHANLRTSCHHRVDALMQPTRSSSGS